MDTTLEHKAFLLLLAIVSVAFFWILIPFYGAVFWAVVLAIIFRPLQRTLERRLRRRGAAAALSVVTCLLIAILPMTIVLGSLVAEAARLVDWLQQGEFTLPRSLADLRGHLPAWAQRGIDNAGLSDLAAMRARLTDAITQATQYLASRAINVGQNTLRFFASLGIMLYVLFFLFRDGPQIGNSIRLALPLSQEHSGALIAKFAAVVRATVRGNIIIALIQGGIGGVAFWLLGIQGALLWGALMVLLSLLPAIGAALVWLPAAIYFLLSGDVTRGVILFVIGAGVIGLVDNLLRPKLVGAETKLPDYVVLVSTLGGLSIFGINGFVIGPMIAALFVASWALYREERARRGGVA